MKKILAIGAHPDDIEYYAGGTLAKMGDLGNEVVFVVATDGRNGSHDGILPEQMINLRKKEQNEAAEKIGAKKIIYLDFEDGELEFHLKNLKQKLLKILLKEKPDIVFTFDPQRQYIVHNDFHPDHRILATAVMDIILIDSTLPIKVKFPLKKPKVFLYNPYKANVRIDISKYFLQKKAAIEEFKSQMLRLETGNAGIEKFRVY